MTKTIYDEPGPMIFNEVRPLASRWPNQAPIFPKPQALQWLKPAGARYMILIDMDDVQEIPQ